VSLTWDERDETGGLSSDIFGRVEAELWDGWRRSATSLRVGGAFLVVEAGFWAGSTTEPRLTRGGTVLALRPV
jgi:hypothetical protein